MSYQKDGGPAFPNDQPYPHGLGMSLRDWFAGQALAGIIAKHQPEIHPVGMACSITDEVARGAYDYADAMLKARQS